jgi:phospholipase/carboxylesterase
MRRQLRGWVWAVLVLGCVDPSRPLDKATPPRETAAAPATAPSGVQPSASTPDTSKANTSEPNVAAETQPSLGSASSDEAAFPLRVLRKTLGGAKASDPLPWVVAFHGLGDTPEGFSQLFEGVPLRVHVYVARAPLPYGSGYDWFGTRVRGETDKLEDAVRRRLDDVARLLDSLANEPQNSGKAVVTGFSQGGILSYAVAVAGLPHVRAALPLAGWLPPGLAGVPPSTPVVAFHGETDSVVPFRATQQMVLSWKSSGSEVNVQFRTYPNVGHTVPPQMHRDWVTELAALVR